MKHLLFLALTLATTATAQDKDYAAWRYVQPIEVKGTGLVRLDLPPDTLSKSQPGLKDIRIVNEAGISVRYSIQWERPVVPGSIGVKNFQSSLLDNQTVLTLSPNTDEKIQSISLVTLARDFVKSATVEGSADGTQWQALASHQAIYDQNGARNLRIPFAPGQWKHLKVTISDPKGDPIVFTGASVTTGSVTMPVHSGPAEISSITEGKTRTTVHVRVPAPNAIMESFRLSVSDKVFQRSVQVKAENRVRAEDSIFRLAADNSNVENLSVPLYTEVTEKELDLVIDNKDNPPLKIDAVTATWFPVTLIIDAGTNKSLRLFTGNGSAPQAEFDITSLLDKIDVATLPTAGTSTLTPNPAFKESASTPLEVGAGAKIDLNGWAYRKSIEAKTPGVQQLELDLETLANADIRLSDLRVIQNDAQIPYLIEETDKTRSHTVAFAAEPAEKDKHLTVWKLAMPQARMPYSSLILTSPTPLFEREFKLFQKEDRHGDWILGTETWQHKPGDTPALRFAGNDGFRIKNDTLYVSTNNGDNAPIELSSVQVENSITYVLFKLTDPKGAYLYYGNPKADMPRYDLSLIGAELRASNRQKASLSGQEQLQPGKSGISDEQVTQGSYLLIIVLCIVTAALLWMVAKLLPKQPSE